jgi:excinuclease ABC subunit B
MSEKQIARELRRLEKEMVACARNLEFEKAAELRDRLAELKKRVFGVELQSE